MKTPARKTGDALGGPPGLRREVGRPRLKLSHAPWAASYEETLGLKGGYTRFGHLVAPTPSRSRYCFQTSASGCSP